MIEVLEEVFVRLNGKIERLREEVEASNQDSLIASPRDGEHIDELNRSRKNLLSQVEIKRNLDLEKYQNVDISISEDELKKSFSFYFLAGKQNLFACSLAGRLRVEHDILSRVQFLKFRPSSALVTIPRPKYERNLSSRKSPISPDLIQPYSIDRVFYARSITPGSFEINSYNFQAAEPKEYVSKLEQLKEPLTLEMCQIDYELNRVILYLENRNRKEYVLRMYDAMSLNLSNSVSINHSLIRLLCKKNEILLYHGDDECDEPLIKIYDSHMNRIHHAFEFDEEIFKRFYSVDDFNDEIILVHGQRGFAILGRNELAIRRELADLDALLSPQDLENDSRFVAANQRYEMHARFEYFNLKLYADFVIVATWSKILLFDTDSLCLYVKSDIYSIPNHNWYLPNRMFLSKYGELVFYDSDNLLLTFV